jgi:hypothetical protein
MAGKALKGHFCVRILGALLRRVCHLRADGCIVSCAVFSVFCGAA